MTTVGPPRDGIPVEQSLVYRNAAVFAAKERWPEEMLVLVQKMMRDHPDYMVNFVPPGHPTPILGCPSGLYAINRFKVGARWLYAPSSILLKAEIIANRERLEVSILERPPD